MASKHKLMLRKELDRFHPTARGWSRQDLTSGRWLPRFLEHQLASHLGGRTPPELKAEFPEQADDTEELAEVVTTQAIHKAIAATDAYVESLTGTEVRNLQDKGLKGGPTKLTGDAIPLVAELLYVVRITIDLMFDVAGAHERVFAGGDMNLVAEIIGRSLGHFDVDAAKAREDFQEQVGAKVFERAIVLTIGNKVAEALRKGFYCYLCKAVGKTVPDYLDAFEAWIPPQAETGPMLAVDPAALEADDAIGFQT